MSCSCWLMVAISVFEFRGCRRSMLSAYRYRFKEASGLSVTISLMYRMKSRSPKMDPCGTLDRTGHGDDMLLLTLTDWVRPVR